MLVDCSGGERCGQYFRGGGVWRSYVQLVLERGDLESLFEWGGMWPACSGGGGYVGSLVVRKHDLVFMILAADAAV